MFCLRNSVDALSQHCYAKARILGNATEIATNVPFMLINTTEVFSSGHSPI